MEAPTRRHLLTEVVTSEKKQKKNDGTSVSDSWNTKAYKGKKRNDACRDDGDTFPHQHYDGDGGKCAKCSHQDLI